MAVARCFFVGLVASLILTVPLSAQAPTGSIRGKVVDSTSRQPLPDATVSIPGTRRGAVTGEDGTFVITGVPAGPQRVRASRIGHAPQLQTVTVAAGTTTPELLFTLQQQVVNLEEVVTTGYGTQRRLAITGSVATIDANTANVGVVTNLDQMIQGRAAGVNMTQNSGEPGAGAQIRIRGGTSISASNEPLYVIDGVPINNVEPEGQGIGIGGTPPLPRNPLNLLNPSDIASVSILKDAAATAIYGARAANGVILVETKRGSTGPSMEYEVYAATSSPYKHLDLVTGDQYRQFVKDQVALGKMTSTQLAGLGTASTDWEQELTRSAMTMNHNLSFSGGSTSTQYRGSLNYMNQEGVVLSNGFKRYQARLNARHQTLDGRLRLALNLTGSQIKNDYLPFENSGGFEGGVFINMVNFNPTFPVTVNDPVTGAPVFFEIGPGSQSVRNPVALADQIQDFGRSTRTLGNASADLDLFSSLTGRVNIGVDRTDGTRQEYFPLANPVGAATNGLANDDNRDNTSLTLQTLLTFHPQISTTTDLEVVGGYEFNSYALNLFGAQAQGFLTDALGFNSLSSGSVLVPPYSYQENSRLVSFFSRANLSLNDKYFLTGVLRRDGSSRFGSGNKWAVFPAISGSWRLSQEEFMRGRSPFSELRLRAGWGKQGNQGVPPYASLIRLAADGGSRYVFGETAVTGFAPISNPNPALKWEETAQTNLAIDYGFLNNRFAGSLEYYIKNTHDLLLTVNVPQPAVAPNRLENVGSLRNKGIEFSMDAQVINSPSTNWTAGLVFSHDNNEVVSLGASSFIITGILSGQGQSGAPSQRIIPGQPLGTFYGPIYAGVNAQGQQIFNKYTVTRDSAGRELTRSLSGTTTTPGGDDLTILGNANPTFSLGLRSNANIGKFDMSFLIHTEHGQKVLNETALVYATKGNALQSKNFLAIALNDGVAITDPSVYSSRWIEDGSFTRLQNITLGYTFDIPRIAGGLKNTRVYVSGDNLLLITGYTGYDPEVFSDAGLASRGIDYLHYPRSRTFTGGVRVAF